MSGWPASLPTSPLLEGYEEDWGEIAIHSQPDEGPSRSRRRFSTPIDTIMWPLLLTTSQLNDLNDFFYNDLGGGSVPFEMRHPRTGAFVNFKIIEAPKPRPDNQLWRVTLKMQRSL